MRGFRRAGSLRASGGLLAQHRPNVAEQRGEKLRHSLVAWQRGERIRTSKHFHLCPCVSMQLNYLERCWCRWRWGCPCECWWWYPRRTAPCRAAAGALWPGRPRPRSWEEAGRASVRPAWRRNEEIPSSACDWTIYQPCVHRYTCL